jgi:hypothetical protein
MKALFYVAIASFIALSACTKSSSLSNTSPPGEWQLLKKYSYIGNTRVLTPSEDSSVLLVLNPNGKYVSELNNKIICQGSYSISTDTAYYNNQVLELNNFITTGIFRLFPEFEIGTNGQVLSVFDGLFIYIKADTLTLSSGATPGGYISYIFVKR